ncbi:hypothetical protein JCM11491_002050 [Sporobolomyces phaffii]
MFPPSRAPSDSAVRSTDADALLSRVSAAKHAYLADAFSPLFLTPAQRKSTEPRPPLINIGTHARTWAVDALVEQFLATREAVQVLSLGAGTDSRFWRMRQRWTDTRGAESWPCRNWVEVDFPEATGAKARTIATKAELKSQLGGDLKVEQGGLGLSSPLYTLLPGDLRDLDLLSSSLLAPRDASSPSPPRLDPTLPTLILLECVLVYLAPETTDGLLSLCASTFPAAAVVSYDPFGLDDSFGQVMKRNLAMRGLSLPGAASTPTLASLSRRLRSNGFAGPSDSLSIKQIRESIIPLDELERVNKIEQIDEVEELNLVLDHYAVTWGHVGSSADEGPALALCAR